jgi:hypothetical protein
MLPLRTLFFSELLDLNPFFTRHPPSRFVEAGWSSRCGGFHRPGDLNVTSLPWSLKLGL